MKTYILAIALVTMGLGMTVVAPAASAVPLVCVDDPGPLTDCWDEDDTACVWMFNPEDLNPFGSGYFCI